MDTQILGVHKQKLNTPTAITSKNGSQDHLLNALPRRKAMTHNTTKATISPNIPNIMSIEIRNQSG